MHNILVIDKNRDDNYDVDTYDFTLTISKRNYKLTSLRTPYRTKNDAVRAGKRAAKKLGLVISRIIYHV